MTKTLRPIALLATFCFLFGACNSIQHMTGINAEDITAHVKFHVEGETVVADVVASDSPDSLNGVRYLRNEQWDQAADAFQKAITAKDDDYWSHFGLAVADEKLGKLKEADEHYKRANFYKSNPEFVAGYKRVEAAMSK